MKEFAALQEEEEQRNPADSSQSLEAFYTKFTSDDDASFLKIMVE